MTALQAEIVQILRESRAGNRRAYERIKVPRESQVFAHGQWHACLINNVSAAGAEIAALDAVGEGNAVKLKVPNFGDVDGRVVRMTEESCAIEFDLDDESKGELDKLLTGKQAAA